MWDNVLRVPQWFLTTTKCSWKYKEICTEISIRHTLRVQIFAGIIFREFSRAREAVSRKLVHVKICTLKVPGKGLWKWSPKCPIEIKHLQQIWSTKPVVVQCNTISINVGKEWRKMTGSSPRLHFFSNSNFFFQSRI